MKRTNQEFKMLRLLNEKLKMTLTPEQLADILFQKPERITKGLLEERTRFACLRDNFLYCTDKDGPQQASFSGKISRSLVMHFNAAHPVESPHPRAIKHAMLELKALGFSNEEVWAIRQMSCETIIEFYENRELEPIKGLSYNDEAFLGMAGNLSVSICAEHHLFEGKSARQRMEIMDQQDKKYKNRPPDQNTPFSSEENEAKAYPYFVEMFRRMKEYKPELFTPVYGKKLSTVIRGKPLE